jgi:hypothetical protein
MCYPPKSLLRLSLPLNEIEPRSNRYGYLHCIGGKRLADGPVRITTVVNTVSPRQTGSRRRAKPDRVFQLSSGGHRAGASRLPTFHPARLPSTLRPRGGVAGRMQLRPMAPHNQQCAFLCAMGLLAPLCRLPGIAAPASICQDISGCHRSPQPHTEW